MDKKTSETCCNQIKKKRFHFIVTWDHRSDSPPPPLPRCSFVHPPPGASSLQPAETSFPGTDYRGNRRLSPPHSLPLNWKRCGEVKHRHYTPTTIPAGARGPPPRSGRNDNHDARRSNSVGALRAARGCFPLALSSTELQVCQASFNHCSTVQHLVKRELRRQHRYRHNSWLNAFKPDEKWKCTEKSSAVFFFFLR